MKLNRTITGQDVWWRSSINSSFKFLTLTIILTLRILGWPQPYVPEVFMVIYSRELLKSSVPAVARPNDIFLATSLNLTPRFVFSVSVGQNKSLDSNSPKYRVLV